MSLLVTLKKKIYDHLIFPLIDSYSPISHAAWGCAIGMFWGMTPTVGIQMWLVWITWIFTKLVLRTQFDILIGTAMVWITNPITMFPIYYLFLITGYWAFDLFGIGGIEINYASFTEKLHHITSNPDAGTWEIIKDGAEFMIIDLGYPMIIGSLFWAIPSAILAYFVTHHWLLIVRQRKAANEGISYEEWRKKYEHDPSEKSLKDVKVYQKEHHHVDR